MVREIVLYGDPVLREKCRPVTLITPQIEALADDMLETMHAAEGIGLAAPQIGEALQLAVIDVSESEKPMTYLRVDGQDVPLASVMPLKFVNPKLTPGKDKVVMNEGCLSFPDIRADIRRSEGITALLTLLDGRTITLETDGLFSRAIQHETDHLNGVLFIDRASAGAKLNLKRKIHRMWEEYASE